MIILMSKLQFDPIPDNISISSVNNEESDDCLKTKQLKDSLMRSLQDLQDIQTHLLDLVTDQDDKIEKIGDSFNRTDIVVDKGTQELIEAKKYHFSYGPIFTGALVGAALISPVSFLINIKLGSLFSFGGGMFGGYAGYKIQK